MKLTLYPILSFLLITLFSCEITMPDAPLENEVLDGPVEGLTLGQQQQFLNGDMAFSQVFTATTGLGPLFVATSCSSCHAGDGKGHPFITFTRFGQSDTTGNQFIQLGGPQLQHKAIPGYQPEILPVGATSSDLIAPAVTGLGFLDAVADQDLIELADPDDIDGDGISGIPNWNTIPDYVTLRPDAISKNGKYITRFGKKAAAYNLLHQTAGAYNQDMGVTSSFEAKDPASGLEFDPEVSNQTLHDVVFYLKTLKAPIPRNTNDPDVLDGKDLFNQIKCTACHVPSLKTGESTVEALNQKEFHPYTDLLLHDMGVELDDDYTEGFALTSEWRTPALWGLGLSKDAQGGSYFLLHDGRAKSIEEAILFHGGEAESSKMAYSELSEFQKQQLISFLESL